MSARSPITTHVLDTAHGRPAAGVAVTLEKHDGGAFHRLASGVTNDDGRITDLLAPGSLQPGTYRICFALAEYWAKYGDSPFFPEASLVFVINDTTHHYHVPLLVSPYAYSTYRGS